MDSVNKFFNNYYDKHYASFSKCYKSIKNYINKTKKEDYCFDLDYEIYEHNFSKGKKFLNNFLSDFECSEEILSHCYNYESLKFSLFFLRKYYIKNIYHEFINNIEETKFWNEENFWKNILIKYYNFLNKIGFLNYVLLYIENKDIKNEKDIYKHKLDSIFEIINS